MAGLLTEHLLWPLQPSRPYANTQASEQGDVECRIETSIEVAAGWRDAARPLQHPKVLGRNGKAPSSLRNAYIVAHHERP